MTPNDRMGESGGPSGSQGDWADTATLPLGEVRELFVTFTKALRAHQLYDENNPVYKRFVSALHDAFRKLWDELPKLQVAVEEDVLAWAGQEVYRAPSRNDSLSFVFFKDGVREITFLPGIEDGELVKLLGVIQRARHAKVEGDDLLTILWEADLQHFEYQFVDLLAEGVEMPQRGGELPDLSEIFQAEVVGADGESEETAADPASGGAGEPDRPVSSVAREDFNPTLYALDPAEMQTLRQELQQEMARDLRSEVLSALFDRLEEPGNPDRQWEILEILRTLLPNFLSHGALVSAAEVVRELVRLREAPEVLADAHRTEVDALLDELSAPSAIDELVQALEDGSIHPDVSALRAFLSQLRTRALGPLLRAAERSGERGLGPLLREAAGGIASRNRRAILNLLEAPDPVVAAGAARLAGEMKLEEAGPAISQLMSHREVGVRKTAVEAGRLLGASTVTRGLILALGDEDGEVRVAAARALGELRYTPAAPRMRELIQGKAIRGADISEKIAFFEAYGAMADPAGVEIMDKLLNGRGFLGRREDPEIRACAALALGRMGTPEALIILQRAAGETDPVVRSAVSRALKGGEGAE